MKQPGMANMPLRLIGASTSSWLQGWQISAHTLRYVAVLQLSELNISNSKLTGTLPSSWSSLKQVTLLYTMLMHEHCLTIDMYTSGPHYKFAIINLCQSLQSGPFCEGDSSLPHSMSNNWLRDLHLLSKVCLCYVNHSVVCLQKSLVHCDSVQCGLG